MTDCDGFRIDTVKHVPFESSRNFCGGIKEFAESIGKNNFLLLGEVTGGAAMARDYLDVFGRNLDAALDIGDPAERLSSIVKGFRPAREFFSIFGGHDQLGSHREVGRYHVSILDDHDMVGRQKRRFSAGNSSPIQVAHATGLQLTTLGIPCIYYGTEQAFDGSPADHDRTIEPYRGNDPPFEDRYIREDMFAGPFGAFRTEGCHFFNQNHPAYLRIAEIATVRNAPNAQGLALRRGRSYLRDISLDGANFKPSEGGEIAAWSRILYRTEVVVCLNTSARSSAATHITIDAALSAGLTHLKVLYPTAGTVAIVRIDGRATVLIQLPEAGMMILAA